VKAKCKKKKVKNLKCAKCKKKKYLAVYKCSFLSSSNMHFRDMIQHLLKSKEKFVLLSSLREAGPDQENK